jgi:hypothetical protein
MTSRLPDVSLMQMDVSSFHFRDKRESSATFAEEADLIVSREDF